MNPIKGVRVTSTTKRERGEGRIFLRGRRWWIAYSYRGHKYYESSRSSERRDAVKLLRKRLAETTAGRYAPEAERVTFEDLVEILVANYKLNGHSSLGRAEECFVHLRRAFGRARAVDI